MTPGTTRRDALVRVIDALHAEIAALKANDVAGLERRVGGTLRRLVDRDETREAADEVMP